MSTGDTQPKLQTKTRKKKKRMETVKAKEPPLQVNYTLHTR